MRPLVPRGLLLPSLVCAALILGPVGTAAAAVDAGRGASDHAVAQQATAHGTDDADTLTDRLDALDHLDALEGPGHGGLLQPLRPLLDAVTDLVSLNGRHLDASEAAAHAKAVAAANTELREKLGHRNGTDRSVPAADPVSDLLDSLQSTIDDLLESLTSLDVGGVLGAVTGLLGSVVGAVTGLLGGGLPSLPAAD
ncbi:hypothetical protein M2163_007505 [Streptomyces sp. SAI-135]|jgi:hypothetical protein|uniref:hypothetical protein n=1 Tax=unclassified Streptomyces TaxID=2593676 RepID=UPI0024771670|nr:MULTISPECIES: hypothetical protein [unclassified Streptomyces]MDH6515516.1 hypothetical protein [Streptomyces sp. SAI-090]MDH6547729.1 hypothetical protein [Streptomyces sp. SAI-041]MDH6566815.1 hypothetical protein [Streptomyces sp. SAI-117]MDH6588245.1 hypothetical protein [Streptomyces sp. SAI-133]MDH6620397.1 hypothetical protein [Streptomyces sp. SAI-135]